MRYVLSSFLFLFFICLASFADEAFVNVDADTLQGLTKEAFVSTNDFESIKTTIERIKINAESCADSIVDLQLGLSGLSHDERLIREKDLNKIIKDFYCIGSELATLSSVDNQGDRSGENNNIETRLNDLEAELSALQNYVQTYLGHLKSQDDVWYFTIDGTLLGTNQTMTANTSQILNTVLVGQTFQVKNESNIRSIKLKVGSIVPPYGNVFVSPFGTSIDTNTFVYANSRSDEGNFIYKYTFADYPVSTSDIYIFGVRTRNSSSQINLLKCNDAYSGSTNCVWIGTGTRYSLDAIKTYDLTAQPNYDLCFEIEFTSQTNIVMGANGIELKNDTPITIDGQSVATVPEINSRIAETSQTIYQSISNHVFGANSIADNSISTSKILDGAVTGPKMASNAVTEGKISDSAVTTTKLDDGAVTGPKIASNAITEGKISDSAITTIKIDDSAVTSQKIIDNAVTANKIADNSISMRHFSQALTNDLITKAGGSITGSLEVVDLTVKNPGNWHIGTQTNKTDLIIDNQDGYISTLDGDLNLMANGTNRMIKAVSFFQFECPGQCGRIKIEEGGTFGIIAENLSSNAVVNITPMQETFSRYWVDIDVLGQATIYISDPTNSCLFFYYTIIHK